MGGPPVKAPTDGTRACELASVRGFVKNEIEVSFPSSEEMLARAVSIVTATMAEEEEGASDTVRTTAVVEVAELRIALVWSDETARKELDEVGDWRMIR